MLRLFTLKNISAFSADAVYKIGLATEQYGIGDDTTETFLSYDELLDAVLFAVENGDHVILAAETASYNSLKREVIGKLLLEEYSSDEICDLITLNAGDDIAEIDMTGHCIVPRGSLYHFSTDGLFCGFSVDALNGKLTCLPLDFMRIDPLLTSLTENVLEPMAAIERGQRPKVKMPDTDITPWIAELVDGLTKSNMKLSLATSEATMWVYNLYDKVEDLTDTITFVEVVDEEPEDDEEATTETESVKIIRHAREAMLNSGTDMGGAISEIYSTEDENGKTVYFAYAAIVDKGSAKAKKINTSNPEDLGAILPHALSVLTGIVNSKTAAVINYNESLFDGSDEEAPAPITVNKEEKKLSKGMLAFACAAVLIAIILPVVLAVSLLSPDETTTTSPYQTLPSQNVFNPATQATSSTQPSAQNPFGTTASVSNTNVAVTEPTAPDIQATTTGTIQASTKGVFTFYVFGYGHGVGMSQIGANYLAGLGWTWQEILAHYYYDPNTIIVLNDTYPDTVTYEGAQYKTREYLARALQQEMSVTSNAEALKAQVVALYTFAKCKGFKMAKNDHAFLGGNETPANTIYAAVDAIMELKPYVQNNGIPAYTFFHAMSAGKTTSYYNAWGKSTGKSFPHLAGGRTSIGDYYDQNFKSTYSISSDDFKALAGNNGITLSGDPATWVSIISHDGAVREDIGYVSSINVGGTIMSGDEFRGDLLGGRIRSHCFTFTYTPTA